MNSVVKEYTGSAKPRREPTLRTAVYSVCVVILLFGIVALTAALIHYVAHREYDRLGQAEMYWAISEELNMMFKVLAVIILPMFLIFPQTLNSDEWRSKTYTVFNIVLGFAFIGIIGSNLGIILDAETRHILSKVETIMTDFLVPLVCITSIGFLLWFQRKHGILVRNEKSQAYFRVQGIIHGCEILLLASCALLAGWTDMETGVQSEFPVETWGHPTTTTTTTMRNNETTTETPGFQSMESSIMMVQQMMPFYVIFSLLLIQVRHYTFNHNEHLTPGEAEARIQQCQEQYHMHHLQRDLMNSKSWHETMMEFLFTAAIIPLHSQCCREKRRENYDSKNSNS